MAVSISTTRLSIELAADGGMTDITEQVQQEIDRMDFKERMVTVFIPSVTLRQLSLASCPQGIYSDSIRHHMRRQTSIKSLLTFSGFYAIVKSLCYRQKGDLGMVEGSRYINKSLEKALSVIELFDREAEELSATEIARKLGTTPGVLYPTLYTLEKHGYLERDGNKKYSLGLKFLERGNLILQQLDLRDKAKPYLRELAHTYNMNTHLAVLYGWKVMYLHREEGYPSVIIKEVVGQRAPAYCTALGKVLLAYLDEKRLNEYLVEEELRPLAPNTITDPKKLKEELRKVRKQGYAIDDEEFREGNMCIAAPVRKYQGKVIAAISVSSLKSRALREQLDEFVRIVGNTALDISRGLGFSGR